MYECCYCKKKIDGQAPYSVPEDYASNPEHDGKPLCEECGGKPTPTLDEICRKLDAEFAAKAPLWPPRSLRRRLVVV
jgi:hypothetical protein